MNERDFLGKFFRAADESREDAILEDLEFFNKRPESSSIRTLIQNIARSVDSITSDIKHTLSGTDDHS